MKQKGFSHVCGMYTTHVCTYYTQVCRKYDLYSRGFLVTNPVPVDAGLFAVGTVEIRR